MIVIIQFALTNKPNEFKYSISYSYDVMTELLCYLQDFHSIKVLK